MKCVLCDDEIAKPLVLCEACEVVCGLFKSAPPRATGEWAAWLVQWPSLTVHDIDKKKMLAKYPRRWIVRVAHVTEDPRDLAAYLMDIGSQALYAVECNTGRPIKGKHSHATDWIWPTPLNLKAITHGEHTAFSTITSEVV